MRKGSKQPPRTPRGVGLRHRAQGVRAQPPLESVRLRPRSPTVWTRSRRDLPFGCEPIARSRHHVNGIVNLAAGRPPDGRQRLLAKLPVLRRLHVGAQNLGRHGTQTATLGLGGGLASSAIQHPGLRRDAGGAPLRTTPHIPRGRLKRPRGIFEAGASALLATCSAAASSAARHSVGTHFRRPGGRAAVRQMRSGRPLPGLLCSIVRASMVLSIDGFLMTPPWRICFRVDLSIAFWWDFSMIYHAWALQEAASVALFVVAALAYSAYACKGTLSLRRFAALSFIYVSYCKMCGLSATSSGCHAAQFSLMAVSRIKMLTFSTSSGLQVRSLQRRESWACRGWWWS